MWVLFGSVDGKFCNDEYRYTFYLTTPANFLSVSKQILVVNLAASLQYLSLLFLIKKKKLEDEHQYLSFFMPLPLVTCSHV